MDGHQVERLRAALRGTAWWTRALGVGAAVRRTRSPGGLLVVGTPAEEPWHFTAHLDDEARWTGLASCGRRWSGGTPLPVHRPTSPLGWTGWRRATRGETVVVVAPEHAPEGLLERVAEPAA